ncbi:MAG: hypothetical protein JWN52_1183 [Actinomycetia bacterium]|nr:hypothetical protein [Actinomycetes bacterium]
MSGITPLRSSDPAHVGEYRLVGRVGEGGQGAVFLGEDEAGLKVAVKLLHARFSGDPKARSRFAAEVATAKRVAPFCTARTIDADVEGDTPYIVSEYIEGPALSDIVSAEGPRAGAALDRIAIGTITALAAIHQAGIVHRDFKPNNVLIAGDGPRVIDFGIARALDATGTLSSTAVGTPAYMAPEQISGVPVGPPADIFAWGCTIVYAAGGSPPYGADSIPAVMHRILNAPPHLGPLTGPLRDIVARCLSKDPAQRPTAHQILIWLLGLAGALPREDGQAAAVLNQGAEAAAADTPSRGVAAPRAPAPGPVAAPPRPGPATPPGGWVSPAVPGPVPGPGPGPMPNLMPGPGPMPGGWAPPPPNGGYGPYGAGPGIGQAPTGPLPRKRRGLGVLAASGTAAAVVLILLGSFTVMKLTGGTSSPTPTYPVGRVGGELHMVMTPATYGIDPSTSAGFGTDLTITKQLYTGLTELKQDGTVQLRLATSIDGDSSCKSWKIAIRTDTRFSNGDPVNADSFVRGINRAAAPKAGAGYLLADVAGYSEVSLGKTATLSGVRASGAELQIDLTAPDCDFDRRLANPVYFPVPLSAGAITNKTYNDHPIGNGPFKVGSYDPKTKVTLVRNPDWAFGTAKLDQIIVDLSDDADLKGVTGFTAGTYDWTTVATSSLASARAQHGSDGMLIKRDIPGLEFLVPVTTGGPMANKYARLAVSYAIDRAQIVKTVFGDQRTPATGLVPAAIPGFRRTGVCDSCEHPSPEKAKANAALAGLPSGTKITLLTTSTASNQQWSQMVQLQLHQVLGWNATIVTKPNSSEIGKVLHSKDATGLARYAWIADYPTATSFLHPLLGSDRISGATGTNLSGWHNSRFDALIKSAESTKDATARLQAAQQAEKVALDDLALIPLWNYSEIRLANTKKFTGLQQDYDGEPTLATAAVK